ncbi:Two-component response regulator-like APRR7-like protein [Drosera capensis]
MRVMNQGLLGANRRTVSERRVENGVVDRGQRLFDDGVSSGNLSRRNVRGTSEGGFPAAASGPVMPLQSSQGTSVCWERFLHVRSLRVLLVENDDSTRHVVAALLRNCCYEVIEASNGIHGWKILEDITIHIDLVLTEVMMPFLSGIALLSKINKMRQNIPVIMMSSHDSMSLVFKCLSKGAVDFLVKPIRKNELKILWQHVWRRCQSQGNFFPCSSQSSGSGSESGTQKQKSFKSKSAERLDSCSADDSEEDSQSPSLNCGNGSDHGSGNQGSWTKQAVEDKVYNSGLVSPVKEISESPNSTCAQVIHPNAAPSEDKLDAADRTKKPCEQKGLLENVEMEKALDICMPRSFDVQLNVAGEIPVEPTRTNQKTTRKLVTFESIDQIDDGTMTSAGKNLCAQISGTDGEALGIINDCNRSRVESKQFASTSTFPKNSETKASKDLPILEQSLKRVRSHNTGKSVQDDRNVLRRSHSSAFSRYYRCMYNSNMQNKTSDPRSPSNLENGIGSEQMPNIQSHSGSNYPTQCSNVDMTSISNNGFNDTQSVRKESEETPSAKDVGLPTFQSAEDDRPSSNQGTVVENIARADAVEPCIQPRCIPDESQAQLHHHLPVCGLKLPLLLDPNSVYSNIGGGLFEGSAGYSLYGSVSGSNHGSNGQNGSSTAANAGGLYNESNNGVGDKSGSGDGSGSGSGNQADQSKLSQREAAVNKFRQKRKERCFKTKVRYQSRRKLAEQRLRVGKNTIPNRSYHIQQEKTIGSVKRCTLAGVKNSTTLSIPFFSQRV